MLKEADQLLLKSDIMKFKFMCKKDYCLNCAEFSIMLSTSSTKKKIED